MRKKKVLNINDLQMGVKVNKSIKISNSFMIGQNFMNYFFEINAKIEIVFYLSNIFN